MIAKEKSSSLTKVEPGGDAAAARPVALIWSALLASDLDHQTFEDALIDLARHHAAIAPPPSYGWWALAAHLYQAELPEVGEAGRRELLAKSIVVDRGVGDRSAQSA